MTFGYNEENNELTENHPDYAEFTNRGELVLDVDEMPSRKLQNIKHCVELAIDANSDDE
jgi:hypothetical protein